MMSVFDRSKNNTNSSCGAITQMLYNPIQNFSVTILFPSCIVLLLGLCSFCSTNAAASIVGGLAEKVPAAVSSLDAADIAPLSDSELDARVATFMKWIDTHAMQPSAAAAQDSERKQREEKKKKEKRRNTWLSDDDDEEEQEQEADAAASRKVFPLEVRRSSRVPTSHFSSSASSKKNVKKSVTTGGGGGDDPSAARRQLQQTLRVFARKSVHKGDTLLRLPGRMIISYSTLCPATSVRQGRSRSNARDQVPDFCEMIRFLQATALEEGTQCSNDQAYFQEGFHQSVLSLFLVYMRWGAGASDSNGGAAFYKPYIDLVPRVPPTPACTFTEADLDLFPLADLVRAEKISAEAQWHFIFMHVAKKFPHVFPQDTLTLPRYMWAQCNVKARMLHCFQNRQPCLVPGVDIGSHASFLGSEYLTRIGLADPKDPDDRATVPQHMLESKNEGDRLVFDMKMESDVTAGREFVVDKDHKESAFLHRGAIESGALETEKFRCSAVSLPRNISLDALAGAAESEEEERLAKKEEQEQREKDKAAAAEAEAAENSRRREAEAVVDAAEEDSNGADDDGDDDDDSVFDAEIKKKKPIVARTEKKQEEEHPPPAAAAVVPPSAEKNLFSEHTSVEAMTEKMDRARRERIRRDFERLFNPCAIQFLAVPSSTAPDYLDVETKAEQHWPYMCLREHELFHTISVIGELHLYNAECSQHNFRQLQRAGVTTETKLRAVAYLGKLVRHQLDTLSEALSKIENVVAAVRAEGRRRGARGGDPAEAEGAFGDSPDPTATNVLEETVEQRKRRLKDLKAQHHQASAAPGGSNKGRKQALPAHVAAQMAQTSLCASWGFAPGGGGSDSLALMSTATSSALTHDAKQKIEESGGKPCTIFEGSDAKHALLIHDWTKTEHQSLSKMYDQLVKLRGQLRTQLRAEEN